MYLYIALGCILTVSIGVILVVLLSIEKDNSNYRRHRTYSEFFEDEV
jgi:hypothetical protein